MLTESVGELGEGASVLRKYPGVLVSSAQGFIGLSAKARSVALAPSPLTRFNCQSLRDQFFPRRPKYLHVALTTMDLDDCKYRLYL